MPYKTKKTGKCYSVINTETGKKKSKCTSKKNAEAQTRLLYGVESGWTPTQKGKGGLIVGENPLIKHSKKQEQNPVVNLFGAGKHYMLRQGNFVRYVPQPLKSPLFLQG